MGKSSFGVYAGRLPGMAPPFIPLFNHSFTPPQGQWLEDMGPRGWEDGSVLRRACLCSRGPGFSSQHPPWGSRSKEPGTPFLASMGTSTVVAYVHTHIPKNKSLLISKLAGSGGGASDPNPWEAERGRLQFQETRGTLWPWKAPGVRTAYGQTGTGSQMLRH